MKQRFLFLCLSLLVAICSVDGAAGNVEESPQQLPVERPTINIAIITDGPMKSFPGLVDLYKREIKQVTAEEFKVAFPKKLQIEADSTVKGINRSLDRLLNNPATSLILTLGPVSSTEALKRSAPAKPVIAPFVLDDTLQQPPKEGVGSGVHNLTYVTLGTSIDGLLSTFRNIISFQHLALFIDERDIAGLPAIERIARRLANEYTIDVDLIPVSGSASDALNKIPTGTDAVMVGPLWQLESDEFKLLSQGLVERRLPSFSMWDYRYLEMGLLATTMPENTQEHLARRVSVTALEVLLGEDPANLPTAFSKTQKLAFNMETARAIDIYPSLDMLTGSKLINEQRTDIQRRLTLPEAVHEALAANLDLAAAERSVAAGTYSVGEARSALLPQVGIGLGGRIIDDDRALAAGGTSPEKAWVGSAVASQQVYTESGWAGYTVEKHLQEGREFNRDSIRLNIMLDSANAYLNVLRQKTIEQIRKDNMQLTQANLERAQIRLSTGIAGPDELYRWQTEFANDRQIVLRAESASLDAMQELNRILHRPLQEEFIAEETDLSDPLLIVGDKLFYHLVHNPRYFKQFNAFAVDESLKLSPELQAIEAGIAAQQRLITQAKRDYWLPDFTLEGSVDQYLSDSGDGQRDGSGSDLDDTDWSVGVFARLPLYEGGRKTSTLGRTREELNQLKTQKMATEERIGRRVLTALNNTRASYPSINLSRQAADAAGRNLQLVSDSYIQGIKSIIDLLDAQNQALSANLDAANAVYNFLVDFMDVQRAIGEFIIFRPAEEQEAWLERAKEYLDGL